MSAHPETALSAYLDGELPPADRAAVVEHLEVCAACRDRLAELAEVDALARELTVEAPSGYFEELPARLRERMRRPAPRRVPVWTVWAAAAAVVAVVAPLSLRESPREAPTLAEPLAHSAAAPPGPLPESGRDQSLQDSGEQDKAPLQEVIAEKSGAEKKTLGRAVDAEATRAPPLRSTAANGALHPDASLPSTEREVGARNEAREAGSAGTFAAAPPPAAPGADSGKPQGAAAARKREGTPSVARGPESPSREGRVDAPEGAVAGGGAGGVPGGVVGGVVGGVPEAARRGAASPRPETRSAPAPKAVEGPRTEEAIQEGTPQQHDALSVDAQAGDVPRGVVGSVQGGLPEERSFEVLAERPSRTAEEARVLREKWRRFLVERPTGARRFEAWVRMIEAGATAWDLGRREEDRAILERDAQAYLKNAKAPQNEKVRTILRRATPSTIPR